MIILALILSFVVTAYAPNSMYSESQNRIVYSRQTNGDNKDAWGLEVSEFLIACSLKYHRHLFVFEEDIPGKQVRYCTDSVLGGRVNHRLDIAMTDGLNDERVKESFDFGKRTLRARVISGESFLKCLGLEKPETKQMLNEAVLAVLSAGETRCLDI
jgi:hypothetical protein